MTYRRLLDEVLEPKVDRLASGDAPRVLELCSGCGGMALGFHRAGYTLSAHLEIEDEAAGTYAANFEAPNEEFAMEWQLARDMTSCSPDAFASALGHKGAVPDLFDVVAAGLPCQAFARVGRSKLRSLTGDTEAFRNDPRARLYETFLTFVRATKPIAIVIENVPDILNFGGRNVPEEICATLDAEGYQTAYTLLNAAFYGVPQLRERLVLIGVHHDLNVAPRFPEPTHSIKLPIGYEASRTVALKYVPSSGHFTRIPVPAKGLPRAISAREALLDLPFIYDHISAPGRLRGRRVADVLQYRAGVNPSEYAQAMRDWPGFPIDSGATGHLIRVTPRDFPIFAKMPHGADYPVAVRVAQQLFATELKKRRISPAERGILARQTIPPYDPTKFPNKWWKLNPGMPSRTLTAHMGKDTYSHIHYDGRQKRTISVREAARLQSFPDGFQFVGQMNAAFRQIGNAVPPLLAFAVARVLREQITEAARAILRNARL